MEIISHRGFWKTAPEKNTEQAFKHSFENGFGTETDVRDCMGKLVISHDMPTGTEMLFEDFLDLTAKGRYSLALNVKSDGLAESMRKILDKSGFVNWFVFDMSIPDMRHHLSIKNPVFTRVSEIEPDPVLYNEASGIWLDAFESIWYTSEMIENWLSDGKRVCMVSPELHKRDHLELWDILKRVNLQRKDGLILCTDIPDQAKQYFEI